MKYQPTEAATRTRLPIAGMISEQVKSDVSFEGRPGKKEMTCRYVTRDLANLCLCCLVVSWYPGAHLDILVPFDDAGLTSALVNDPREPLLLSPLTYSSSGYCHYLGLDRSD